MKSFLLAYALVLICVPSVILATCKFICAGCLIGTICWHFDPVSSYQSDPRLVQSIDIRSTLSHKPPWICHRPAQDPFSISYTAFWTCTQISLTALHQRLGVIHNLASHPRCRLPSPECRSQAQARGSHGEIADEVPDETSDLDESREQRQNSTVELCDDK